MIDDLAIRLEQLGEEFVRRFEAKFRKTKGCWLWRGAKHKQGYGKIVVYKRIELAHRVAYVLYKRKLRRGDCVLHRCDVVECVRPSHLFRGTQLDNMRDRQEKLRQAHGERNGTAKFTWDEVRDVRRRYADGEMMADLAREYRVCHDTISKMVRCVTWQYEEAA